MDIEGESLGEELIEDVFTQLEESVGQLVLVRYDSTHGVYIQDDDQSDQPNKKKEPPKPLDFTLPTFEKIMADEAKDKEDEDDDDDEEDDESEDERAPDEVLKSLQPPKIIIKEMSFDYQDLFVSVIRKPGYHTLETESQTIGISPAVQDNHVIYERRLYLDPLEKRIRNSGVATPAGEPPTLPRTKLQRLVYGRYDFPIMYIDELKYMDKQQWYRSYQRFSDKRKDYEGQTQGKYT